MVARATIAMLVLLTLALGAGAVAVQSQTVSGPVYTVAQLQAGFARHPRAWIGRSVLVRGNVSRFAVTTLCSSRGCQPQTQEWLVMETPPQVFRSGGQIRISHGPPQGLVLAPGPTVRLLDALVHLPLVGRYLSDHYLSDRLPNGVHHLRLVSARSCRLWWPSSCVNAVLLEP